MIDVLYYEDNDQADFDLRSITWADYDNDGDLDVVIPSVPVREDSCYRAVARSELPLLQHGDKLQVGVQTQHVPPGIVLLRAGGIVVVGGPVRLKEHSMVPGAHCQPGIVTVADNIATVRRNDPWKLIAPWPRVVDGLTRDTLGHQACGRPWRGRRRWFYTGRNHQDEKQ